MKMPARNIVAFLLVMVYAMITMSPLAPMALKSPRVAHAITGECSGNCDICGCSAERRANRTCCCWMKKLKYQHADEKASCCKKKMCHRMAMISCNCPCGSDRLPGLPGITAAEHLPNMASYSLVPTKVDSLVFVTDKQLYGIAGEPPEPPPKIPFFC